MSMVFGKAIADYLSSKGFGGLYDDPNVFDRVLYVQHKPPVPVEDPAPDSAETGAEFAIAIFVESFPQEHHGLVERYQVVVETRHKNAEDADAKARELHVLLNENGGQSNGANPNATGQWGTVKVCWFRATGMPVPIGQDPGPEGGRVVYQQTFEAMTRPI